MSIEALETMDRVKYVDICLEDESWMKRIFTDWLFDDEMKIKYHFVGLQTKWIKDKAGTVSDYSFHDSCLFESSNEGGMGIAMDIDGGPQEMGPGYPRSQDFGHDSGPTTSSSQVLVSGSDPNDSSLDNWQSIRKTGPNSTANCNK